MRKKKATDFFEKASEIMPAESIERAEIQAERELIKIGLAELRKKVGLKQEDIPGFSQTSVSRIEHRQDLKLSTLLEYVHGLGLELEIKARPKGKKASRGDFIILKS